MVLRITEYILFISFGFVNTKKKELENSHFEKNLLISDGLKKLTVA